MAGVVDHRRPATRSAPATSGSSDGTSAGPPERVLWSRMAASTPVHWPAEVTLKTAPELGTCSGPSGAGTCRLCELWVKCTDCLPCVANRSLIGENGRV